MSHTITVTRIIDDPNPEVETDDPEYEIGGSHDHSCGVWYPCKVEGCTADDEGEFHGEEHIMVGGIDDLCTLGAGCGLAFTFEYENPEFQMTELGVYDVEVDWDGDHWLAFLTLRNNPEPQAEVSRGLSNE